MKEILDNMAATMEQASLRGASSSRDLEQVNYWRNRAGWYDDDSKMEDYNTGVYETYYESDDGVFSSSGSAVGNIVTLAFRIVGLLVVMGLALFLYRAYAGRKVDRKSSTEKERSSSRSRSKSADRSRSKSAERSRSSRSRSRSKRGNSSSSDYKLMDDDKSRKSTRSSRSRSRSVRSTRSNRSRSRSRSRGRQEGRPAKESRPIQGPVLV